MSRLLDVIRSANEHREKDEEPKFELMLPAMIEWEWRNRTALR